MLTSLGIGGAERQVVALAERMKVRGHAVVLILLRERQPEEWPTTVDLVCLEMRKTPPSFIAGLLRARRWLRDFRPELIHSHVFPANMAARLLRISLPAAVLSTVHNVYEGSWPRMLAYRLTDGLSRRTAFVSQAAAERFVRLKAVPARKASVFTNGIDLAEFAPNAERRALLRARMGVGEEFVWLAAGRIVPAKDFPNLLRAFARVRGEIPEAQLWIAGEALGAGSETIQAQAAEWGASIRRLGLRRDMPALLDAADGFVLASAWEGMPLALGEAMAMGKPVVATNIGGVRELAGDAGVIVPVKEPDLLARAMLDVMDRRPEERAAMGRAARARIEDGFTIEAGVKAWERLYESVLEKDSR